MCFKITLKEALNILFALNILLTPTVHKHQTTETALRQQKQNPPASKRIAPTGTAKVCQLQEQQLQAETHFTLNRYIMNRSKNSARRIWP
jgi:hypothetical protein